ncbi:unnamed protein product [Porites evermanni]|uniref:Uncharacterized protein n=1 Tax=Porites evermanni TaxID=104178 RepID=A0ABN8SVB5_9CNID|nr:unnamed protein product [Porites evermanni]
MATLRELLKVPERMFKNLFDSLLANVNARLDSVIGQVAEMKARLDTFEKDSSNLKVSLEFSQKDIKDLKPCSSRLHEVEEEIEKMCGSLDYHTHKIEYLENQSRRNKIRIDGIREEEAETWNNTETKVKEILKEKLNLDEEPDIERAHRVGRRANATTGSVRRLRTIVCRDWKQKEQIIRSARRIKPPGIFINEDLAQETLDKREEQRPKFEEARRNGKIAYFV